MQFIDLKEQYRHIETDLMKRVATVLDHQKFIQGPEVTELEYSLAEFCGAKHTVSCANGTDALQVALMALAVGPGSAVFVPSFTYTATAEVIVLLGATPVFVDVDPEGYNIDPDSLEAAIARVRKEGELELAAVITVDLFGMPVDYDRVREITRRERLAVISDAAQAFGASHRGRRIGSGLADVTTTSFFPAKPLGCYGDGGAIFTDDSDLADKMRSICLHGKGGAKYDVSRIGVNSRLDTLQAAILLSKLAIFDEELERRNAVARRYCELLPDNVVRPVLPTAGDRFAWAQFTLQFDNRDAVQRRMREAGIPTAIYYPRPMHLQPAYTQFASGDLGVSERLSTRVLSLPMHPYLEEEELNTIAEAVTVAQLESETA